MRYPSLKENTQKSFKITPENKGLDLSNSPLYIDKGFIADGLNMYFSDGAYKTRPAINANNNVFETDDESVENISYEYIDTQVIIDKKPYRILVKSCGDGVSFHFSHIFFISKEAETIYSGNILRSRVTDDTFFVPSNITFYQGKSENGFGIFALLSLENMENPQEKIYEIYELNSDFSGWTPIYDYYTPIVYINGRGNKYESMLSTGQIFTGKPTFLESLNLLDGSFYSYYSSDGASNSFRLPYAKIANTTVICTVHISSSKYVEWRVLANETSATNKLFDVDITFNVDREKGIFYFICPAGDYSVPLMDQYRENNIKIFARKEIADSFANVVSSKCTVNYGSGIFLSGGRGKNKIYTTSYQNPLYFPENSIQQVGNPNSEVLNLAVQDDKIIAFKENEIYSVKVQNAKAINTISLLMDNDKIFYGDYSFSTYCISNSLGCMKKGSVNQYLSEAVFMGTDSNVYMISGLTQRGIANISSSIQNKISKTESQDIITINYGAYIMFALGNKAFVINRFNWNKGEGWFYWEFPQEVEIIGGFEGEKSPIIICKNGDIGYTATLDGIKDCIVTNEGATEQDVNSFLVTKEYSAKGVNFRKRLDKIYLQLNLKGRTVVEISNGDKTVKTTIDKNTQDKLKKFSIIPSLKKFNSVFLKISSQKPLWVGEIDVFYSELEE